MIWRGLQCGIRFKPLGTLSRMSTTSVPVQTERISPILTLRRVIRNQTDTSGSESLVIFFPWLYASQRGIDKYCQLYHERGMDVLSVACGLKYFLMPSTSKPLARHLLEYLNTSHVGQGSSQFLVHSMSIGAFVYTVVLMEMAADISKYGAVRHKIKGQIFDSLTLGNVSEMANGIANNFQNPITRMLVKGSAHSYFFLTHPFTVKFYDESMDFFKEQPIRSPMVIYYSQSDPMCNPRSMQVMVDHWREDFGIDLVVKCWDKSQHAGHLMRYPDEYRSILNDYFNRCSTLVKSNL